LHPLGKKGVRISSEKYSVVKDATLESLREDGDASRKHLKKEVERKLGGRFMGSISWYFTPVKLDMEARGIIIVEKGHHGHNCSGEH
jgi:hypothetical protein